MRSTRATLLTAAVVLAIGVGVLSGCDSETGDDPAATGPATADPATADPEALAGTSGAAPSADLITTVATGCTAVANARDPAVMEPAREALYALIESAISEEEPTDAELDAWSAAIDDYTDAIEQENKELTSLSDDPRWLEATSGYGLDVPMLDERLAAARRGDREAILATAGTASPGLSDLDLLAELGLDQRDCLALTAVTAPDPDHVAFVTGATEACGTILDRRRLSEDAAAQERSLEIVAAVRSGDEIPAGAEYLAAAEQRAAEAEATSDELAALDASNVPDAAAWQNLLDAAALTAERHRDRADALRSGDADRIGDAYGQPLSADALLDWASVGLDTRQCAFVS